ncbi:hypothetical protein ACFWN7_09865 [Agromyces sp. NPDC058484]|uniref:hypothetical protein n=1 Tax=Agromyces sp. NPDC058484 TaxID=3346524 RepID=UPI00364B418B
MFNEPTAIGLDVHARSVRAAVLDTITGEVIEAKLPPDSVEIVDWVAGIAQQHGPVHAAYEAGPTGFGLARKLLAAGIGCTGRGAVEDHPAGRGQGQDRRAGRVTAGAAAADERAGRGASPACAGSQP